MPCTELPTVDAPIAAHRTRARISSGTFPVSRGYQLRQMLFNPGSGSEVHSGDVPIYADTVDLETVAFHQFWGCLLTPENIAAQIRTDNIRYHAWVAAKKVVEQNSCKRGRSIQGYGDDPEREDALLDATMDKFLVELSLALLDLCPGPVVVFIDPRLHASTEVMVNKARSLIALFDEANIRRWRLIVTLPATEEGMRAAAVLTHEHSIQTNLSLVSCLSHASACIEAGAKMITMSVGKILEWYEKQQRLAAQITPDHLGMETVQTCASYILQHKLNTTLMAADVRSWTELKQLSGIGAAALTQQQLDQIPMHTLVTWFPRADDASRSTQSARAAPYPTQYLKSKRGFFLSLLPADQRSLVSAVLYVRLGQMSALMREIESVVREEVRFHVEVMTVDLRTIYLSRRKEPVMSGDGDGRKKSRRGRSRSSSSSSRVIDGDGEKSRVSRTLASSPVHDTTTKMIEGVDYF